MLLDKVPSSAPAGHVPAPTQKENGNAFLCFIFVRTASKLFPVIILLASSLKTLHEDTSSRVGIILPPVPKINLSDSQCFLFYSCGY